jgi:hypothetical protein
MIGSYYPISFIHTLYFAAQFHETGKFAGVPLLPKLSALFDKALEEELLPKDGGKYPPRHVLATYLFLEEILALLKSFGVELEESVNLFKGVTYLGATHHNARTLGAMIIAFASSVASGQSSKEIGRDIGAWRRLSSLSLLNPHQVDSLSNPGLKSSGSKWCLGEVDSSLEPYPVRLSSEEALNGEIKDSYETLYGQIKSAIRLSLETTPPSENLILPLAAVSEVLNQALYRVPYCMGSDISLSAHARVTSALVLAILTQFEIEDDAFTTKEVLYRESKRPLRIKDSSPSASLTIEEERNFQELLSRWGSDNEVHALKLTLLNIELAGGDEYVPFSGKDLKEGSDDLHLLFTSSLATLLERLLKEGILIKPVHQSRNRAIFLIHQRLFDKFFNEVRKIEDEWETEKNTLSFKVVGKDFLLQALLSNSLSQTLEEFTLKIHDLDLQVGGALGKLTERNSSNDPLAKKDTRDSDEKGEAIGMVKISLATSHPAIMARGAVSLAQYITREDDLNYFFEGGLLFKGDKRGVSTASLRPRALTICGDDLTEILNEVEEINHSLKRYVALNPSCKLIGGGVFNSYSNSLAQLQVYLDEELQSLSEIKAVEWITTKDSGSDNQDLSLGDVIILFGDLVRFHDFARGRNFFEKLTAVTGGAEVRLLKILAREVSAKVFGDLESFNKLINQKRFKSLTQLQFGDGDQSLNAWAKESVSGLVFALKLYAATNFNY